MNKDFLNYRYTVLLQSLIQEFRDAGLPLEDILDITDSVSSAKRVSYNRKPKLKLIKIAPSSNW